MKRVICLVSAGVCALSLLAAPRPEALVPIYDINQAQGVEFVLRLPQYQDEVQYGVKPNCLDNSCFGSLNATIDWSNSTTSSICSKKDLYIAKLKNAFVSPLYLGTVFDYGQQFLFDLVVNPGKPIFWPIRESINRFSVQRFLKLATVQGPSLFYHWVIDRLPSVFLLRDIIVNDPQVKLMINSNGQIKSYVFEYLDLLGITAGKRIVGHSNVLYMANELYFATPFLMEPIPRKLLLALREELLQAAYRQYPMQEHHDNLIVVIQRAENDRKIGNLAAVLTLLKAKFESKQYKVVVYDASMPVAKQIQLFNNARLVIGVMASGLTNVLYMKQGTSVIELHPSMPMSQGAEWCWWLACAIGAQYWALPTAFTFSDKFVTCPLQGLKAILDEITL